jgi:hypothetical protein
VIKEFTAAIRSPAANIRLTQLSGALTRNSRVPGLWRLAPLLLLDPFNKKGLKLILGVDTFVNKESIHRINGRLETLFS